MITLDLFESENNKDPKQPGRIENPAIAGTDKTAKSGYYPKPAAPVQKLAQPTDRFDKVTKEGAGDIGAQIRAAYQKIYDAGDDAVESAYYDSPIFAQYWDEYEGDLDSIIAEVDPSELQVILAELTSAVEDQGLAEVSNATLKSYQQKVSADSMKHSADPTKRSPEKASRSVAGFAKAQNRLEKGVAEGSETAADIDKKIEFHKQGQAAAQYKGSMNKMHAAKIRELEAKKQALKQDVAEDDAGDVEQRMIAKIEKEKQRLAKLKQTDPEAYKREMAKREAERARMPAVSTFEEQGVAEAQPEPEQQQMDANRRAALRREREPAGSEKIDARLAQQHAQRQEYEKTGKFWIKQKDTQQHISDAFTGKAAANAAALDLLKQRPELRGNLVITAYGPGEQQSVKEAVTRFPYPEGSENLGRANMEVLIRAYSTPTSERTTLYFGDKAVELDRNDIEAIAEYYDDKLPTNEARWNFIRAVMNNYDNFQTMLNKIGRRSAASVRQPGLFQEADKKKDDEDLGKVKDVVLQRAIAKARADFPSAGSGLEALAQDFMKSQEQDRRDFDQLQTAKRRHDQLLSQISKVDNEQAQEINDLENQNSVMSQRLQQLQNVNSELEKKLSAMTGRREKRQTSKSTTSSTAASTASAPTVVAPKPAAKKRIKKQAAPKSKAIKIRPSAAIGSVASQLAPQAAPQLPAPADGDVLPPMFGRSTNTDLQRGKETATDTEFRDLPIMRAAAPQAQAAAESQNKKEHEVDYDDPRWDAMVSRVGKLAKAGPLKTVWDPVKRVYKNVPASDNKKPVKEQEPSAQGRAAMKNVSDWAERLRVAHELQKDVKLMADPEAKAAVQQRVRDLLAHGIKQGYVK